MFDYDVLTEDQAMQERYKLLKDGIYRGVIKRSVAKPSSNGNNMFEMDLDIYDENGRSHFVRDFLVFTANMIWKVRHCAESTGTLEEFENKKFSPPLLENKNVLVSIKIQKGNVIPIDKLNGKPQGSCYPDKNAVDDYLVLEKKPPTTEDFIDSDIPF